MQRSRARPLFISLPLSALLLCACVKQETGARAADAAPDAKPVAARDSAGRNEVRLEADEAAKLGLAATPAAAAQFVPSTQGFGVVLSHEAIAQAVADLATAQAQAQQSQAVLARMKRLAGTAGAESAEAHEGAVRQAAVDEAAVRLAEAKSSAILGQRPPWTGRQDSRVPGDLAEGRAKLLRVTFPLGALDGGAPSSLWISRLDAAATAQRWTADAVWAAPADPGLPGRSFFALLRHSDAGEGERLLAWTRGAKSERAASGVLVPPSAVIISDGKYWCYVEREKGVFVRVPIDLNRPMADGYFVAGRLKSGDLIVTAAAGLLLARQSHRSPEGE